MKALYSKREISLIFKLRLLCYMLTQKEWKLISLIRNSSIYIAEAWKYGMASRHGKRLMKHYFKPRFLHMLQWIYTCSMVNTNHNWIGWKPNECTVSRWQLHRAMRKTCLEIWKTLTSCSYSPSFVGEAT